VGIAAGRFPLVIFYEAGRHRDAGLAHDPFKALVTPRPIGWVSTMSDDGLVNLAPYSFFNAIGEAPPMLAFSSKSAKDSATFAGVLREFVWNLVTFELREQMNATSAPLPRGRSEFERAGLEMAPSRLVAPPRVAAARCAMECRVVHSVELHDVDGRPGRPAPRDRSGGRRPPRRGGDRARCGQHHRPAAGGPAGRPGRLHGGA
jgi:flavin reductase (DIM6/NTAB) family NADH-FMN oxidoreductase RutF